MKIEWLKLEEIHILTQPPFTKIEVDPDTNHYLWTGNEFIFVHTPDGKIELPITPNIPNLFGIINMERDLEVEACVYMANFPTTRGMGVLFNNVTEKLDA